MALYKASPAGVPPTEDPLLEEIDALQVGAYNRLTEAKRLQDAGRLEEALREYEAVLQMNPQLIQAHVNLISICGVLKKFDEASRFWRAALTVRPALLLSRYNLACGLALFGKGKDSVTEILEIAREFFDSSLLALTILGPLNGFKISREDLVC